MNNFGELKTEVLRLIASEKDTQSQASVEQWCRFGLQDCFDVIRPIWAIRAAVVTIDTDSQAILPPSYIAMNAIFPASGGLPLQPITAEQAGINLLNVDAEPSYLIEGTLMTIIPNPGVQTQYRLSYWSELEPLINPSDTNAWITKGGQAVLFASARYAMEYQENDEALQRYENAFQSLAAQITGVGIRARTGSGVVIRRVK